MIALFLLADVPQDTLRPGDIVKVEVAGTAGFSETGAVDDSGFLYLRLIGKLRAGGLSLSEFKDTLRSHLLPYYKDPLILLSIENLTPPQVLVTGRVNSPGYIQFRKGMTLSDAVQAAGGPSSDARLSGVVIKTRRDGKWESKRADLAAILSGKTEDVPVYPGQVIVVPKAFRLCTMENFNFVMSLANTGMMILALYLLFTK
ncbi:MAG: polysaccharide biosynthesis/export family protein [candidate division WOR-3 bacterium]